VGGISNRPEATDCTAGQLKIEVRDSGIGISRQHQAHVFEAFSQADDTVSRKFGGTGLGLAISKRLTEMLGGTIQVESELGKGSTFTITVGTGDVAAVGMIQPRTTDDWASKEWSVANLSLDCHVLVVDDRRDIRFLTTSLLKRSGARTSEAEDGEVAVKTVKEMINGGQRYDLILLDMQMPRLDGYQTAVQLRKLGYAGPIVALTANAMQGDMARCMECGCNDYLSKPIDVDQLTQKVFELTSLK
jgi:CheY-like chemotaxis protein